MSLSLSVSPSLSLPLSPSPPLSLPLSPSPSLSPYPPLSLSPSPPLSLPLPLSPSLLLSLPPLSIFLPTSLCLPLAPSLSLSLPPLSLAPLSPYLSLSPSLPLSLPTPPLSLSRPPLPPLSDYLPTPLSLAPPLSPPFSPPLSLYLPTPTLSLPSISPSHLTSHLTSLSFLQRVSARTCKTGWWGTRALTWLATTFFQMSVGPSRRFSVKCCAVKTRAVSVWCTCALKRLSAFSRTPRPWPGLDSLVFTPVSRLITISAPAPRSRCLIFDYHQVQQFWVPAGPSWGLNDEQRTV